jgi:meso-butanediol dehydrogenase/(S,S)-butanediol dehydrogenase/diacetyl reductase
MRGLKDKHVLVTGGASGIGKATVVRFLEEGSRVVVLDKDQQALDRLASERPGIAGFIMADVSDPEDVTRAFATFDTLLGSLDVLINNAGISIRSDFSDISHDDWRRVMSVNLDGVFFVAQQAARRMLVRESGVILNMGSTNGLVGYNRHAIYNTSKAGVINLTRSMALELAPKVRVNVVCPGFVATPLLSYPESVAESIPLKRLAQPEEVAALFAFLASDDAGYITGQALVIDGGELAGGLASR